jgi:hypothetical protein
MIMEFLYSLFGSNPGLTERQEAKLAPVVTAKSKQIGKI